MSRKDYIRLADVLKKISNLDERKQVAREIAETCAEDNRRFDYLRFYRACGVEK